MIPQHLQWIARASSCWFNDNPRPAELQAVAFLLQSQRGQHCGGPCQRHQEWFRQGAVRASLWQWQHWGLWPLGGGVAGRSRRRLPTRPHLPLHHCRPVQTTPWWRQVICWEWQFWHIWLATFQYIVHLQERTLQRTKWLILKCYLHVVLYSKKTLSCLYCTCCAHLL